MNQAQVEKMIKGEFSPAFMEVVDQKFRHIKHEEDAKGWHFNMTIVSEHFKGLSMIERHKLIYKLFQSYIDDATIHALAIRSYTPQEWAKKNK